MKYPGGHAEVAGWVGLELRRMVWAGTINVVVCIQNRDGN